MSLSLAPALTPHGALRPETTEDDFPLDAAVASRLAERFARGEGHGLLQLGLGEIGSPLSPALAFWRGFAMRFVATLCARQDPTAEAAAKIPVPSPAELEALIDEAPPMRGGEYLRPAALEALWRSMQTALSVERADSGLSLQDFLKVRDSRWRLVGRVHFNLAENRKDPECPFAFMATYTASLAAHGVLRHLPLGQALREYAGANDKEKLLKLLEPVSQASEACGWLKEIVDSGEIFPERPGGRLRDL